MKKKLHFTVEKEIDSTGESLTGNKTITVYNIVDNEPSVFFELNSSNENSSKKEIQNYLNDNHGYDDDDFELIQL